MSDISPNNRIPSAIELFAPSVKAVKVNLKILLVFVVASGVLGYFVNKGFHYTTYVNPVTGYKSVRLHYGTQGGVMALLGTCFSLVTYPMYTFLQLSGAKGKHMTFREMLAESKPYWLRLIGLLFVSMFIYMISAILLLVPVIFALRNYLLAPYFMIDKNLGVGEALRQSKVYSSASGWVTFWVVLFAGALALTQFIPYVGYVISSGLAFAYSAAPAVLYSYVCKVNVSGQGKVNAWSVDF